jgi:hypothetical protein
MGLSSRKTLRHRVNGYPRLDGSRPHRRIFATGRSRAACALWRPTDVLSKDHTVEFLATPLPIFGQLAMLRSDEWARLSTAPVPAEKSAGPEEQ